MKTIILTPEELRQRGITELVGNLPVQPESAVAHKYLDGLYGIEIGPAAYQPFGLDAIGIIPDDEHVKAFYRQVQLVVAWAYTDPDLHADAENIPVEDNSQDFVLSSHVLEHTPNPIKCFVEWIRVIHDGGYIYMIVPTPDALESDKGRPLATHEDWVNAVKEDAPTAINGHFFVYNLDSLKNLIERSWHQADGLPWLELVTEQAQDDKCGNGFALVYRVHKPAPDDPRLYTGETDRGDLEAKLGVVDPDDYGPDGEPDIETLQKMVVAADPGYPDAEPTLLKVFSVEDKTVETVMPEDGTIISEIKPKKTRSKKS